MVGFELNRFLRKGIPAESLCFLCQNVMNLPVQCSKCKIWVCQSCSENSAHLNCKHEYSEPNKFLKNKIGEMMIKCKYWVNGCLFLSKVNQIEKHEEGCEFGKTDCQYPECVQKTAKCKEQVHSENCPFSIYKCDKGCGKEMKLIERDSHNCLAWLQVVIENLQIKNRVINEENKDLKEEEAGINNKFTTVSSQLEKEIKNTENKNQNLEKDNAKLQQDIKNEMSKTQDKIKKKISEVLDNIEQKFDVYSARAQKEFELLDRRIHDQFSAFLQKNSEQLYDFNVRVQADSYHISGISNDMKQLDNNPLKNTIMASPSRGGNVSKILGSSLNKSQVSQIAEKK